MNYGWSQQLGQGRGNVLVQASSGKVLYIIQWHQVELSQEGLGSSIMVPLREVSRTKQE